MAKINYIYLRKANLIKLKELSSAFSLTKIKCNLKYNKLHMKKKNIKKVN